MSVEEIISNLENDDMIGAEDAFKSALNDKMSAALEQEKINVASTMFNDEVEEETVENDFDEDIEVADEDEFTEEEIDNEIESGDDETVEETE